MDFDKYIENERIKNDPMEQKPKYYCNNCTFEIYSGDKYYDFEGQILCEECFDEKLEQLKQSIEKIA